MRGKGTVESPYIVSFADPDTEDFYNPAQPRDKDGQWSAAPGSGTPKPKLVTALKNTNGAPAKSTIKALSWAAEFYKSKGLTAKRTGNLLTVYDNGVARLHVKYSPIKETYVVHGRNGLSKLATAAINGTKAEMAKTPTTLQSKPKSEPSSANTKSMDAAMAKLDVALQKTVGVKSSTKGLPLPAPGTRIAGTGLGDPVARPATKRGPAVTVTDVKNVDSFFNAFDDTTPLTADMSGDAIRSRVAERRPSVSSWMSDFGTLGYGFQAIPTGRPPTEREAYALGFYTGSGYTAMNAFLRDQPWMSGYKATQTDGFGQLTKGYKQEYTNRAIDLLTKYLDDQRMPEPIEVYRTGDLPKSLRTGDVFVDRGFVSTARTRFATQDLGGINDPENFERHSTITIKVPKGAKALAVSDEEDELLLQRGTKFRVVGFDEDGQPQVEVIVDSNQ